MKINSLHIVSFGKLKNVKIDFSDNFNMVFGDNEAGKTHIADFIKLMFYGSASRAQGVNNLRKKYKPWDSGKMGGSIDFTVNGTNYRIEREFKATNSTDTIVLHNLDLGVSENISGSENLGERFFSVSLEAFEQSVFIDNSVVFAGGSEELNLKLSNLCTNADEDISFDKIIKNLSSSRESLISKNRKNGPIPETQAQIAKLKEARLNCIDIFEKANELENEKAELIEKSELAKKEKNNLFEQLKKFEIHFLKEKLTEFKKAATLYENTEEKLKLSNGKIADNEFLKSAESGIQSLKLKAKEIDIKKESISADTEKIAEITENEPQNDNLISSYKAEKEKIDGEITKLDNKISETLINISAKNQNGSKKPNITLLIIGLVLLITGILAGISSPYLFTLSASGIIFIVLSFTLNKTKSGDTAEQNKLLEQLKQQKQALQNSADTINSKLNDAIVHIKTENSLLSRMKEESLSRRTELLTLTEEFERQKAMVLSEITLFKPVFDIDSANAALLEIKELLSTLSEAKLHADLSIKGTGCRGKEDAERKLASIPKDLPEITASREQLQEEFNNSVKVCSDLQNRITSLSAKIVALTKNVPTPAEYEKKILEAQEKLDNMKEFVEIIDIASANLNEAYANQRSSWGKVLETRVLEIFSLLTNNAYSDMLISKDFEISVKKETDITAHTAEYLSRGTFQQAYLSLRLALSEFLSEEAGSLPIILDDAFAQFDDKRTALGFEFLKEYAKEHQIIFFTCHKELTEKYGENIIPLN